MKRNITQYPASQVKAHALKEAALAAAPPPQLVNVRAAKHQLSSLLELAAGGHEIII